MKTIQASGWEITVFVWESTTDAQYSRKMAVLKKIWIVQAKASVILDHTEKNTTFFTIA